MNNHALLTAALVLCLFAAGCADLGFVNVSSGNSASDYGWSSFDYPAYYAGPASYNAWRAQYPVQYRHVEAHRSWQPYYEPAYAGAGYRNLAPPAQWQAQQQEAQYRQNTQASQADYQRNVQQMQADYQRNAQQMQADYQRNVAQAQANQAQAQAKYEQNKKELEDRYNALHPH
jgi:hypothetical protein